MIFVKIIFNYIYIFIYFFIDALLPVAMVKVKLTHSGASQRTVCVQGCHSQPIRSRGLLRPRTNDWPGLSLCLIFLSSILPKWYNCLGNAPPDRRCSLLLNRFFQITSDGVTARALWKFWSEISRRLTKKKKYIFPPAELFYTLFFFFNKGVIKSFRPFFSQWPQFWACSAAWVQIPTATSD